MYTVYKIEVDGVCLYIGHSKDLKKREYQHNYLYKKGAKKSLYDYLRECEYKGRLTLIPIKSFKKKIDAKRYEMYLILQNSWFRMLPSFIDDFDENTPLIALKQRIPSISDK